METAIDRKQLNLLHCLVEINSCSNNISGIENVQSIVAQQLSKLGFDFEFINNQSTPSAPARMLIGERRHTRNVPFINFVVHADTVFEADTLKNTLSIEKRKGIARGPGVIDDKGGIVIALTGLEAFLRNYSGHANFRFICSPTEEIGSPGFGKLLRHFSDDAFMILGFEPSLDDGSIISNRRGNRWYQIDIEGKEEHAGRNFHQGVNAAYELALKLSKIHDISDKSKDLTVNLGQVGGGSKFNIVCGHAHAKLDVRFSDTESRDHAHREIDRIIHTTYVEPSMNGSLPVSTYQIVDDCPPVKSNEISAHFINRYLSNIYKTEGRRVRAAKSGGSADINYMARENVIIIDGLGATGGGMHTIEEFIRIDSLSTRSESLANFLNYVCADSGYVDHSPEDHELLALSVAHT